MGQVDQHVAVDVVEVQVPFVDGPFDLFLREPGVEQGGDHPRPEQIPGTEPARRAALQQSTVKMIVYLVNSYGYKS